MSLHNARFAGLVLVLALAAAACGGDPEPDGDRKKVAIAKCSLPVSEKAGFDKDEGVLADTAVEELGSGRYRVIGLATNRSPGDMDSGVEFICEVAPDSSDDLRGFKVTRIEIGATVE